MIYGIYAQCLEALAGEVALTQAGESLSGQRWQIWTELHLEPEPCKLHITQWSHCCHTGPGIIDGAHHTTNVKSRSLFGKLKRHWIGDFILISSKWNMLIFRITVPAMCTNQRMSQQMLWDFWDSPAIWPKVGLSLNRWGCCWASNLRTERGMEKQVMTDSHYMDT